jgi:hypothetical protein
MTDNKLREELMRIIIEEEKNLTDGFIYYNIVEDDELFNVKVLADKILSKFDSVIDEILDKDQERCNCSCCRDCRSQIKQNWEEMKK